MTRARLPVRSPPPRRSSAWLAGIEIGDETDAYARHGFRTKPWGPVRYLSQVNAYRRAIDRLAPGIPLAGPDVSGSRSFQRWGPAEVRSQRPAMMTGHHYPLGCHLGARGVDPALLAPDPLRRGNVAGALHAGREPAHVPLRVDRANTVSCGGMAGSATRSPAALWATSYIAHTMTVGIAAGINLEGNPARCTGYSVVCASSPARLAAGQLQAQPEWYALLSHAVPDRGSPRFQDEPEGTIRYEPDEHGAARA